MVKQYFILHENELLDRRIIIFLYRFLLFQKTLVGFLQFYNFQLI